MILSAQEFKSSWLTSVGHDSAGSLEEELLRSMVIDWGLQIGAKAAVTGLASGEDYWKVIRELIQTGLDHPELDTRHGWKWGRGN